MGSASALISGHYFGFMKNSETVSDAGPLHRGSSKRVGCGERSEPHRSRKTSIDAVPYGHRILLELALAVLVGTGVAAGAKHDRPRETRGKNVSKLKNSSQLVKE